MPKTITADSVVGSQVCAEGIVNSRAELTVPGSVVFSFSLPVEFCRFCRFCGSGHMPIVRASHACERVRTTRARVRTRFGCSGTQNCRTDGSCGTANRCGRVAYDTSHYER